MVEPSTDTVDGSAEFYLFMGIKSGKEEKQRR